MHCELIVPSLFAVHTTPRLPALELLLARGRATHTGSLTLEAWLAEGFGLDDGPLAAGAVTAHAQEEDGSVAAGDAFWLRADPVHLRLGRDHVTLIPSAGFALSRDEADALVAALNRHFGTELLFLAVRPEQWCLRTSAGAAPETLAPLELAGHEVDANLPRGPDAPRWHALLNEIQMALHDHPVNAQREERGAPVVNSLWLWGAGRLPQSARGPWHSVTADDPLAAGAARLAGMRHRGLPAGADEWLGRVPGEGRHLVVLDALRAALALGGEESHGERLATLEARWFAPLLDALRRGRIGMLTVRAPEAGYTSETVRSDLRRFWRRARPLGSYA